MGSNLRNQAGKMQSTPSQSVGMDLIKTTGERKER